MNMCRDYEYYVDVLSDEPVELGTRAYPYKELETVFVEILHLHSNKPHKVSIYIKEGTSNYLHLDKNYIVNMTKVTITTYSNGSTESGRALIIGTDEISKKATLVVSSMKFVLKTLERPVSKVLKSYGGLTTSEIASLISGMSVLHIIKTGFLTDKIDFITEHADDFDQYSFVRLTHPKRTWTEISNSYVDASGYFLRAVEQSNVRLNNIVFECYRSLWIVQILEYCQDLNILQDSEFHANNITIEFSKPSIDARFRYLFLLMPGRNIFLNHIYMQISPTSTYYVFIPYMAST